MAPLDEIPSLVISVPSPASEQKPSQRRPSIGKWVLTTGAVVGTAAALLALGVVYGHRTARPVTPDFQRLTARRGTVYTARFAPDGRTVYYTAAWDGGPLEIFQSDLSFNGTRSVGLPGSGLLAVSSSGEMAVAQAATNRFMLTLQGTLGQVPLTGGSPRAITEDVEWADWTSDGKSLAVVRRLRGSERLEFPVGHILYETPGWISIKAVVCWRSDRVPGPSDRDGMTVVWSRRSILWDKEDLSTGWESVEGLAWKPGGKEIWFSAAKAGLQRRIYGVDLSGNVKLRYSAPGGVTLEDIAPDGRILLTRDEPRAGMMGRAAGASQEKNLSWLDGRCRRICRPMASRCCSASKESRAGRLIRSRFATCLGRLQHRLAKGWPEHFLLTANGSARRWITTGSFYIPREQGPQSISIPRVFNNTGTLCGWLPDGKQLLFMGREMGRESRCYVQSIDGGKPRPITPEGVIDCRVSPDGKWIAAKDVATRVGRLYSLSNGEVRDIPGASRNRKLLLGSRSEVPVRDEGKGCPDEGLSSGSRHRQARAIPRIEPERYDRDL